MRLIKNKKILKSHAMRPRGVRTYCGRLPRDFDGRITEAGKETCEVCKSEREHEEAMQPPIDQ